MAAAPFTVTDEVVPVTVQLSTELPPAATDVADAVKFAMTGAVAEACAAFTVAVMLLLAVPPGPTAIKVKVVVLFIVVDPEPLVAGATPVCAPFDNVAEVAPVKV